MSLRTYLSASFLPAALLAVSLASTSSARASVITATCTGGGGYVCTPASATVNGTNEFTVSIVSKSILEDFTSSTTSGTLVLSFSGNNGSINSATIANAFTGYNFLTATIADGGTYGFNSSNVSIASGVLDLNFSGIKDDSAHVTVLFNLAPSVATAPEPSSLMLLGTGLVVSAGMLRRRIFPVS